MANKVVGVAALLFVAGFGLAFAQDRGVIDVTLDVRFNVAEYSDFTYSDESIRPGSNNYSYLSLGPLDGNWFTKDSVIRFSYSRENFGGSMVLRPADFGTPPWRAWLNIGPMFRVSAGNDNESLYADAQGADPGFRVYNGTQGDNGWNGSINPDNITQDNGLLLESFLGPVTVAITGLVLNPGKMVEIIDDGTNTFVSENRKLRAGARLGSEIGKWGKVNASYFATYERQGASFNAFEGELRPTLSGAEFYNHHFGVFAGLAPLENLGVTFGYGGIAVQYLDEFWNRSNGVKQQTVQPSVLYNALMLNARYTDLIPGLTLRTDHNYTFWTDKNLGSLASNISGWIDRGPLSTTTYPETPDVGHIVLWNGIGTSYRLGDVLGLELYVRNLFRRDFANETNDESYILDRNEFFVEPKVVLHLSQFAKIELAVAIINTTTGASEDLNFRGRTQFNVLDGSSRRKLATSDSEFRIEVPIGVTMQF